MDEVTFIRINDGDNDELSCQSCVFYDTCSQSDELPIVIQCPTIGDYWKVKR